MNVHRTELPGVFILEPRVFSDDRGFFLEMYHAARFQAAGLDATFVQTNRSHSKRGTLRGLHYQVEYPQGKLVQVVAGEILCVAVDLRRSSSMFGKWVSVQLSGSNFRQLFIPPGLAHGFCVNSDTAEVIYQCTDLYHPEHERTIRWNDPQLAIGWPIPEPLVSEKDARGLLFAEAPYFT